MSTLTLFQERTLMKKTLFFCITLLAVLFIFGCDDSESSKNTNDSDAAQIIDTDVEEETEEEQKVDTEEKTDEEVKIVDTDTPEVTVDTDTQDVADEDTVNSETDSDTVEKSDADE